MTAVILKILHPFKYPGLTERTKGGQYALKKEHFYWHQIQRDMYFSSRKFFLAAKDVHGSYKKIVRDETWSEKFQSVRSFILITSS